MADEENIQFSVNVITMASFAGQESHDSSAVSNKKKKKKENSKEKKAATAAATTTTATGNGKKPPKHVREILEVLARRKEAEERNRREEEERLRKEEEERLQEEELERQAEEARRRKKEKLLKKKQEGRLLTAKQKEEARRLESVRKQFAAAYAGDLPLAAADIGGTATKRPIYQKNKAKPLTQLQSDDGTFPDPVENIDAKYSLLETVSDDNVVCMESKKLKEVVLDSTNVEGDCFKGDDDKEGELNAKSWDDDDDDDADDADVKLLNRGAFADEESESELESEHVVKRERKNAAVPEKNATSALPTKPLNLDNKRKIQQHDQVEVTDDKRRQEAVVKKEAVKDDPVPKISEENHLRSTICCVMGHVDAGKTKLLDSIRGTNVQGGEAGGITQQIGATYIPAENIRERTKELKADAKLKVPGLLVIDTPGHESFTNLRSRGSCLCDIAILVVDIMDGLKPQTIESLNLLKSRKTNFLVALNKVDRLYGWKACRNAPIRKAMKQQSDNVKKEFDTRLSFVVEEFKKQGLNTKLYYKNREMGDFFNIIPTSAISGEGIPDLLLSLVQTQNTMTKQLIYSDKVQCTVLEVQTVEGHGKVIDAVLINGVLHKGDQIVVCGMEGPIVTRIRALMTPHPMKEFRVKGKCLHHEEVKAAQCIRITAQGLEDAVAGTGLYVMGPDDVLEDMKEVAMEDKNSVFSRINKSGVGVCVQASTLGSLEALLEFLKTPEVSIPVSHISIGPVHKRDVMKANLMLEKKQEYAAILAFDVKVIEEAREHAEELGVKIFTANVIYHLFDEFKAYVHNLKEAKKEASNDAVFPCILKIIPNCIFNKKDPIILGVEVLAGIAKVGTPICVPCKGCIDIGRIASIKIKDKPVDRAKKGEEVSIKIVASNPDEQQRMFGKHFELEDELVSRITRRSIDSLRENYRNDLLKEDCKRLVITLKKVFGIP